MTRSLNKSLTISTAAGSPFWIGEITMQVFFHYIYSIYMIKPTLSCSYSLSLKKTADIMFGGKQVAVCGYGEVRLLIPVKDSFYCQYAS